MLKLCGKNNKEFLYLKLLTNFYSINVRFDIEIRNLKNRFNRKERKVLSNVSKVKKNSHRLKELKMIFKSFNLWLKKNRQVCIFAVRINLCSFVPLQL
ncbi:hypothetical protein C4F50_20150 [Flavobacterium sp. KB82]|uniref:Uncharacterized protein n=1 Tax=Flavobacterium hungaricum TaxID=2082725 RepID=A0ABR9TPD5_9FLAO|nr:hypothetical protein [Flavobacterium hungaricum]